MPWVDEEWMTEGACVGSPPELFFSEYPHEVEIAKRICAECSVRSECGEYARQHDLHGIWGGMTQPERRGKRRRAARAARVAASPPSSRCPGCQQSGTTVPVGGGYGECVSCKARYPWP